jgi:hypothetical protein
MYCVVCVERKLLIALYMFWQYGLENVSVWLQQQERLKFRIGTNSRRRGTNVHHVFPWVHQYVNNLRPEHQTQRVSFPDINPTDLPPSAQFSMAAGDFLEVWSHLCLGNMFQFCIVLFWGQQMEVICFCCFVCLSGNLWLSCFEVLVEGCIMYFIHTSYANISNSFVSAPYLWCCCVK